MFTLRPAAVPLFFDCRNQIELYVSVRETTVPMFGLHHRAALPSSRCRSTIARRTAGIVEMTMKSA
jgi:hypothetical protein